VANANLCRCYDQDSEAKALPPAFFGGPPIPIFGAPTALLAEVVGTIAAIGTIGAIGVFAAPGGACAPDIDIMAPRVLPAGAGAELVMPKKSSTGDDELVVVIAGGDCAGGPAATNGSEPKKSS